MPNARQLSDARKKLSLEVRERMIELDCDPLAFAIKIMKGEELTKDHPLVIPLQIKIRGLVGFVKGLNVLEKDEKEGMITEWEQFEDYCVKVLSDSYVPAEVRMKQANELLGYLYPKQSAVKVDLTSRTESGPIKPLTLAEITKFKARFFRNY